MHDLQTPFYEATRSVFQMMLDLSDITDGTGDGFACEGGLDISIDVVGDLTGTVVYRFPRETSLNIVKIMSGMEIDSVDEFVTSAISEIANIISGNVMTLLADNQLTCDISTPKLGCVVGGVSEKSTSCCISTSAGDVCLDIRLKEAR